MTRPFHNSQDPLPRTADGFEIESELGRGGMGVVYLARELASGRRVALKVLAVSLSDSEEAFERFQREAVLAASISDSRCVFVYGAHQFEGSPAIAMELVRGRTLEQVIKQEPAVPIRKAVRWMLELIDGLEAAHRAGVLHRDVKPSNCFVAEDGHLKIGDFGLSRSLETDVQLTQAGAFLGSPLYAAPEQIKGRRVDERSDQYSAAATLYALLTGEAPYSGSNIGEVLSRILTEAPDSPRLRRPDLPPALEKVLLRAMEKDPDERYPSLQALREALHPYSVEAQAGTLPRRFGAYVIDVAILLTAVGTLKILIALLFASSSHLLDFGVTLAYFALLEGLWGSTPGKWLLGLRTVATKSGERSLPRAALRALVFTSPTLLSRWIGSFEAEAGSLVGLTVAASSAVFPVAVHLLFFVTARKRNGMRAVHEWASATRVLQRPLPFPLYRRASVQVARGLHEASSTSSIVGPYRVRGLVANTQVGRLFEADDAVLARRVWLFVCEKACIEFEDGRRQLARPGRLHWLESLQHEGLHYEVFEAPGGDSLANWARAQTAVDWPTILRTLVELAEELEQTRSDGSAARFSTDQVWIDRSGNVRLLDVSVDAGGASPGSDNELLAASARLLMPAGAALPRSLPASAEPVMRRILALDEPFASAASAREELAAQAQGAPELNRRQRALQLSLAGAAVVFVQCLVLVTLVLVGKFGGDDGRARLCLDELRTGQDSSTAQALDADDVRARQIMLQVLLSRFGGASVKSHLSADEQRILDEAALAAPHFREAEEQSWAKKEFEGKSTSPDSAYDKLFNDGRSLQGTMFLSIPLFGWLICIAGALITRGGLSFRLFGMLVRDGRGEEASRWRCAWRSALAWSPMLVTALPAVWSGIPEVVGFSLFVVAGLAFVAGAALAVRRPVRALPDLLAGTWLVPR